MPTAAPELLPIFRSETQAQLLAEVFFGRPASGSELARRLGLSQPTVARELARLAEAGIVTMEEVGRAKVVRPADAPYTEALRQLVAYAAGAPHIVRDEYLDVADIDEVFIHGSWAARFHGEPGPPPNDLDLVVVSSTHTRFTLAEHRAAIEAATGLTVDQMVLPPDHDQLATLRDGSVPVMTRGDDS
jgi:DNA-binding transcriptional ArsR family regulator